MELKYLGPLGILLCVAVVVALSARLAAQPEDSAESLPGWITQRLTQLDPADPKAYFLLGEEVAGEIQSKVEEQLATQLFGLAFELDRADGSPTWIAPSSCLALASLARLESDGRWLRALASRLDPDYAPPRWRGASQDSSVSEAAFNTAEAVGEARAGHGIQARQLLDKLGVQDLLLRYGRLLGFSASTGALWQIDKWANEWPCRECGNERVVFRPDTDPPSYRECYTCRGNPGPVLTNDQLVAQLRFESRLLHGISRSWGAQLAIDYAAPLREPVADELASVMGIEADKPYWRNGWVASPDAPEEAGPTLDDEPTTDTPPDPASNTPDG
ncbi:hypothetical protein MNBD_PLANCTO03-2295 [hydrothermal vent metagenome]|uniref:Uncharacterized protein n=1 Tax=hydrothermal vent metagenome TaxID=652676 RepID=A0A3B1DUN0_9ZZZZ